MKFSFTHRGQLQKLLLHLNDQNIFNDDWSINEPQDTTVISLNLDMPGRPYSGHTATETLFQFLSDGETKTSLSMLVGLAKVEYKLDKDRFSELLDICQERLDKNYKLVTWLDILMVLLICQLFPKDDQLRQWAANHISEITEKNKSITKHLRRLSNNKADPIW